MARRIKTIAAELQVKYPELWITVSKWRSDTDGKVAGTRFRRQGKGRLGTRIQVYYTLGVAAREAAWGPIQVLYDGEETALSQAARVLEGVRPIFDHKAGETYRSNDEVEQWAADYAACKAGRHRKWCHSKHPAICSVCSLTVVP